MTEIPTRFSELPLRGTYQPHEDRLNDFYIPSLKLALSYDRLVGYWRSSSLVVAAAGIPYFIRNAFAQGGRMRIIAGAELTAGDIAAFDNGEPLDELVTRKLLEDPASAVDIIGQERLKLIAWMVNEGLLEIKIGVPTDPNGRPLAPDEAGKLFHTKFGILTDAAGDRVVFQGSVNESARGWKHNHEAFNLFRSWQPEIWEEYGQSWVDTFEQHWSSTEPVAGWKILDFPEAVKEKLISETLEPDWIPPEFDPAEPLDEAALELKLILEAPTEAGGTGVGFVTLPITPWPHQTQIASRILETWPRSYLLADEVGLGKTIEAGMVVRELLLSGKANKILLLVPASVQRQWQEELWEKFCLDVPSYEQGKFVNYAGEVIPHNGSPWSAFPVVLASSHLARMRSQRDAVLAAGPWDLVFVDEAHHARRRGIGGKEGANQLLQLLRQMRDAEMWKALLLATATPMQMNTHDIFDLLDLFGLPGRWGVSAENFDFYYQQLAEPEMKARDWPPVRAMLADFLAQPDTGPNPSAIDQLRQLPGPMRMRIERFDRFSFTGTQISEFSVEARALLDRWLRANTPIRDRIHRTSREALREYQRQGILAADATIPRRHVRDEMISFESAEEEKLYKRIEDYITRYYEQYNQEKATKPLGFIMTVYRRRLTSSLYAILCSLERRLDALQETASLDEMLDDDDKFALENSSTFEPDQLSEHAIDYADEMEELRGFIAQLEVAIPRDTKAQKVSDEIHQAFLDGHRTVVVFTQFGDTLTWLRDQLRGTYKTQIACYTGQGGSRYNPETERWEGTSKEEVKELFREGKDIRILIGTDAMSEGLNLQTCDKLINYDMPWNFMRVEQRIGRIDRIGGKPDVYITNYFYKDTVEEQVYSGIKEDAQWFDQVVGPAQPVLGQVESVIQDLAMRTAGKARDDAIQSEIEAVRKAIEAAAKRPVTLDTLESDAVITEGGYGAAPAMGLEKIERTLIANRLSSRFLHPHDDFANTYWVEYEGEKRAMTFDLNVYDQNPEIGFMTYGHPVFDGLLEPVLR